MENFNEQSVQQVDRFLKKVVQKFPSETEATVMTDIHVRVSPESGDLMAFDDDDVEITRCVVEDWIANTQEDFYDMAAAILRSRTVQFSSVIDAMSILKPYSFVLENEEGEHIAELYVSGDDMNIIGGDIMEGWDKDLDSFLDELMKD